MYNFLLSLAKTYLCLGAGLWFPVWARNSRWWRIQTVYLKKQVCIAVMFGSYESSRQSPQKWGPFTQEGSWSRLEFECLKEEECSSSGSSSSTDFTKFIHVLKFLNILLLLLCYCRGCPPRKVGGGACSALNLWNPGCPALWFVWFSSCLEAKIRH